MSFPDDIENRPHGFKYGEDYWCAVCKDWYKLVPNEYGNVHAHLMFLYIGDVKGRESKVVPEEAEIIYSPSGAKSSKINIRYDLVPPCFLQRVAERFTLGSKHYADYNWRQGVEDDEFVQARINHMLAHLQSFLSGTQYIQQHKENPDDDLAAVGWCISMLMEFQNHPEGKKTIERCIKRMNFKK